MNSGHIVFDLETQKTFDEIGSRSPKKLGVSVCCLYSYDEDRYSDFFEKDLSQMENLFLDAGMIVGFNIRRFDLPALQPYFSASVETLPVFDMLEELTGLLGHRVSLDSLARATLGTHKTADGLEAIRFYRENRWDELRAYCQNDVKITKDLFDYALKQGELFYLSRDHSKKIRVAVDWYEKLKSQQPKMRAPAQYKLL